MSIKERDIVLQGRDGGEDTIDLPITRLGNIESGAAGKLEPAQGDYIPIIDVADNEQMKKFPVQWLLEKLLEKQDKLLGEAGLVVGFNAAGEPEAQSTQALVGPQGPQGIQGPMGPQGPVGPQGPAAPCGAQFAMGAYAGAGAAGQSSPNSITTPFAARIIWIFASSTINRYLYVPTIGSERLPTIFVMDILGTSYGMHPTPAFYRDYAVEALKSPDGKTLTWYADSSNPSTQANDSGTTYYWLALA